MYRTLIAKEILEHLKSARFALVVLLCLAGFGLNALALKERFIAQSRDYSLTYAQYDLKMADCSPVQSMPFWVKPPTPLMAVFNEPRQAEGRAYPPLAALFRTMDYSLCAALLLSLIALLLGFDTITGEREKGTLRILLVGGTPRSMILFCKFAAVVAMTALPFLMSVGLGLVIAWPAGSSLFTAQDWLAFLEFLAGAICYVAVFAALGCAVSAACRSSGASLTASLLAWVALAIMIPNIVPEMYACLRETPSAWSVKQQHAVTSQKQTEDRDRHSERFFREHPDGDWLAYIAGDSSFYNGMKRWIIRDLEIDQDHNRVMADRMNAAYAWSRISPFASMMSISQTLSHTGILEYSAYNRFVQTYSTGFVDLWRAAMMKGPLRIRDMHAELPAGTYEYLRLSERFEHALPDFVLLIAWTVLLFLAAFGLWSRSPEA